MTADLEPLQTPNAILTSLVDLVMRTFVLAVFGRPRPVMSFNFAKLAEKAKLARPGMHDAYMLQITWSSQRFSQQLPDARKAVRNDATPYLALLGV